MGTPLQRVTHLSIDCLPPTSDLEILEQELDHLTELLYLPQTPNLQHSLVIQSWAGFVHCGLHCCAVVFSRPQ